MMAEVFCLRCGHANPDEAQFCGTCGSALIGPGAPVTADGAADAGLTVLQAVELAEHDLEELPVGERVLQALPPGAAMLLVLRGPNAGSRFLLDRDLTTAGRHPDSDIFFDDVTVSRRHAEFRRDAAVFLVRDVGSLNGTYVNRIRVQEAPLRTGDRVQVGKYRLVFYAAPPPAWLDRGRKSVDRSSTGAATPRGAPPASLVALLAGADAQRFSLRHGVAGRRHRG